MSCLYGFRKYLAGAAALWLCACSHAPSADDIPADATFTTKILANDTKLFVYKQGGQRGGGGAPDGGGQGPGGGAGEAPDRGGFGGGAGPGRGQQSGQAAMRGVQAMLARNHYCREGFVVIEQYEEHGSYTIRGECRDAATSAEREIFTR